MTPRGEGGGALGCAPVSWAADTEPTAIQAASAAAGTISHVTTFLPDIWRSLRQWWAAAFLPDVRLAAMPL